MRTLALLLSFGVGFLSLSQEIVWVRIVAFGQGGLPHAFSAVLAAFLMGIALGSVIGRRICIRSTNVLRAAGWCLTIAAAADFATLYLAATSLGVTSANPWHLVVLLMFIAANACLKGVLFPIVHHLGTSTQSGMVGRSVSHVYLGNVIGATLGPIITGFWLFELVSVETVFALIGTFTAALALVTLTFGRPRSLQGTAAPAALLILGVAAVLNPPDIISNIAVQTSGGTLRHIQQNKHGVIHVIAEGKPGDGDVTFGNNAYDGRINVDMKVNSNTLQRAFVMATLHPRPRRVLVVGLSTGAWTAVIRGMPGVETIDVIEINPGYLELIKDYPEVAPVLTDERIHIHVDDARRWLRAHPEQRYDLIFQNTTWHWRAYVTLLLSKEYFHELSTHLDKGGIVAVNTTESLDIYRTAIEVFPHVARYDTFAYMSFDPLIKRADAETVLRQCTVWGRPAFDDSLFLAGKLGDQLAHAPLESAAHYIERTQTSQTPLVISDLNMVTEFRHSGNPLIGLMHRVLPFTNSSAD